MSPRTLRQCLTSLPAHRLARIVVASVLGALPGSVTAAQGVSAACFETCPNALADPAGATACAARISLCQTKLLLYQSYMGQLSTGVSRLALPGLYTQILQQHYPT